MTEDFSVPTGDEIDELEEQIKAVIRGKGPMLQGAALADIVAMYFAGHHPMIREETIDLWITAMRGLVKVNEAALFEAYGGKPEGWEAS